MKFTTVKYLFRVPG